MMRTLVVAAVLGVGGVVWGEVRAVGVGEVRVVGDLGHREMLNLGRLTGGYYEPGKLERVSPDWAGDAVGREILALTLLSRGTGVEVPRLGELIAGVARGLNEGGYLGKVLPTEVENEQYLSGHSWLLRGLCEYQEWRRDEVSLGLIKRVVAGLLLPARGRYAGYPIRAEDRPKSGGVAGNITHTVNGWELSSDVGCAFIMLDGATRALEVVPSAELEGLIKEMIARFGEVDLMGVGAQTHATLSALRGVLRFYKTHPEPAYLAMVKERFELYWGRATTEHYANYNWFGRPEWTEACAVVDSYMLAMQLYGVTGEVGYLERGQLIYFNALAHAQRPNGGFGCDVCVGSDAKSVVIKAHEIYEAPFCCSMRGAEGLTAAGTYSYLVGEDEVVLPVFQDNVGEVKVGGGVMRLAEVTGYPVVGDVTLDVVGTTVEGEVGVRFFIPSWVKGETVKVVVNGKKIDAKVEGGFVSVKRKWAAGDQVGVTFEIGLREEGALHPGLVGGKVRYFHGALLLGGSGEGKGGEFEMIGPARYRSKDGGVVLSPIGDLTYGTEGEARGKGQELLFEK